MSPNEIKDGLTTMHFIFKRKGHELEEFVLSHALTYIKELEAKVKEP